MDPEKFARIDVSQIDELSAWLEANHASQDSVWLVTWKAAWRDRFVSREQVLDVLIAYGWIDGRRMKLDADRTMQLISPRKQQAWAQTYIDRADRLEQEGRMRPPGRKALEAARRSAVFDSMRPVDRLEDPDDLLKELDAAGGRNWWENAAPSYRRNILRWIAGAKGADTRLKRIGIATTHAAMGKKVPNY
jgi:uncharacterized protein YdeI (YjbR/CyaY-like superfamily)